MQSDISAKQSLIHFLKGFNQLSPDLVQILAESIPVIAPTKGTILLKEGQIQHECYFVLKGLVRQYHIEKGVERTTEFYTESHGTVSSQHYTDQSASSFYLQCVEDCLLIAGKLELDTKQFEAHPELLEITKLMLESDLNKAKANYTKFISSSPTERYLHFIESRPDLLNRVPLHQIAGYLGMTAESLSRIRRRIMQ